MTQTNIKIGILTASDRASAGKYADISGKAIETYFKNKIKNDWEVKFLLVPDSFNEIKKGIISLSDKFECNLVVTTGGTGPSARDITPEATEAACSRMLPGFGERMRAESLKYVPTAILSRQTAGIRGNTLIINLPGKPEAINQCLDAVFPAIPDCIKIIGGPIIESKDGDTKIYH
jgi:molybdopterin adenylyltransferase